MERPKQIEIVRLGTDEVVLTIELPAVVPELPAELPAE